MYDHLGLVLQRVEVLSGSPATVVAEVALGDHAGGLQLLCVLVHPGTGTRPQPHSGTEITFVLHVLSVLGVAEANGALEIWVNLTGVIVNPGSEERLFMIIMMEGTDLSCLILGSPSILFS